MAHPFVFPDPTLSEHLPTRAGPPPSSLRPSRVPCPPSLFRNFVTLTHPLPLAPDQIPAFVSAHRSQHHQHSPARLSHLPDHSRFHPSFRGPSAHPFVFFRPPVRAQDHPAVQFQLQFHLLLHLFRSSLFPSPRSSMKRPRERGLYVPLLARSSVHGRRAPISYQCPSPSPV